ncbi:MAG: SGNH/GDSL hydrolase family protein [Clostridia bacterium]|nr:SGNH/GDSL hydrolase family protein [Clostridia bacterium]
MKLQGLKVAFLGDSITEGVGTSAPENIYLNVLKKEAGLKEALNYGVSGTRFARQNLLDTDEAIELDNNSFSVRFKTMDDTADAVVVFGGTNDFGHGDAPIGCFDDRQPDTFYGACHYIFSGLIKKYLGKPIVIMTPLHRYEEARIEQDGKLKQLLDYVNIIREVAEFYALPVLDLYATSGIQPKVEEIKKLYMPDGLHPSDDGNAVIAAKLKNFMEFCL